MYTRGGGAGRPSPVLPLSQPSYAQRAGPSGTPCLGPTPTVRAPPLAIPSANSPLAAAEREAAIAPVTGAGLDVDLPCGLVPPLPLPPSPISRGTAWGRGWHGAGGCGAGGSLDGSLLSASGGGLGGLGVGTRPWWLALLACGGAYWPLALEPAMTSRASVLLRASACLGGTPECLGGGGCSSPPPLLLARFISADEASPGCPRGTGRLPPPPPPRRLPAGLL